MVILLNSVFKFLDVFIYLLMYSIICGYFQ